MESPLIQSSPAIQKDDFKKVVISDEHENQEEKQGDQLPYSVYNEIVFFFRRGIPLSLSAVTFLKCFFFFWWIGRESRVQKQKMFTNKVFHETFMSKNLRCIKKKTIVQRGFSKKGLEKYFCEKHEKFHDINMLKSWIYLTPRCWTLKGRKVGIFSPYLRLATF